MKKNKKLKYKSIKSLEKKLKRVLYPLIKKRDGNVCISCGRTELEGANWHAGHYAKAELCNIKWRYNPLNIHSQCAMCNVWGRGNTLAYRENLIKKIGLENVEMIEENYRKPMPSFFNYRTWLEKEIKFYEQLLSI